MSMLVQIFLAYPSGSLEGPNELCGQVPAPFFASGFAAMALVAGVENHVVLFL